MLECDRECGNLVIVGATLQTGENSSIDAILKIVLGILRLPLLQCLCRLLTLESNHPSCKSYVLKRPYTTAELILLI